MTATPSTFEIHADRLDSYRSALEAGLDPSEVVAMIRRLDAAVAEVDGHGFEPTPSAVQTRLQSSIDLGSQLWVKDETGNVSGSHKGRHLFGVALQRMVDEAIGTVDEGRFAIASCGNAALGATVVARALDHPIDVFVPTWAEAAVVDKIVSLGGNVVRCERDPSVAGDPTHHAMVAAVANGGIAFSCQGTDTPSTIDGGRTLGWELVDALIANDESDSTHLERLFVQVGGGALASSTVLALADDVGRGRLDSMPVIHPVQPVGNHPFARAWDLVVSDMLERPAPLEDRAGAASELGRIDGPSLRAVMAKVSADQDKYMWPWEDEPVSFADGILDDITYDWLPILEATLATGGWPVVASEDEFHRAHDLAHEHTDIDVSATGASGFAGLLSLLSRGQIPGSDERVAVLFTGLTR